MDLSGQGVCHFPRPGGFRTNNLLLHPGIDFLHLTVLEASMEICQFAFCTSTWEGIGTGSGLTPIGGM